MTIKVWTDRSRYITAERCKRRRWYEYHEGGMGIRSASQPLPLAVGGAVHAGLASLLLGASEEDAVACALAEFAQYTPALELDSGEQATFTPPAAGEDPALADMLVASKGRFDAYLVAEQTALVEALVRAYARRRLRPLLEQYEVLEVEREGQWTLWDGKGEDDMGKYQKNYSLWFMSRPDALLLDRQSRHLFILSFKTTGGWDVRKARDIEHDMQGLSEGIEVERRLAEWWHEARDTIRLPGPWAKEKGMSMEMWNYLTDCTAPPRILGIRYEFLLKGDRRSDKELQQEIGLDVRAQRSHLIRGYLNKGMTAGDAQWNWSFQYLKEGGEASRLYAKNWPSAPVWEHMTIKEWIDKLDATAELVVADADASGMSVQQAGWSSPAQATGTTATHPLDDAFIPPIIVYRSEDDLRDLVEQMEASEVRIADGAAAVNAASDDGEKRHLLNVHFPMSRHSCEYPSQCPFAKVCFGSEELRRDPMASGMFVPREPNHPQEVGE
jgi:hypothetical protein